METYFMYFFSHYNFRGFDIHFIYITSTWIVLLIVGNITSHDTSLPEILPPPGKHRSTGISKFPLMKCWFLENQQNKISNHVPCDTFWTCFSKVKRYCCLFLIHTYINDSSLYQPGSNVFPHRRCPPPQFGLQAGPESSIHIGHSIS